MPVKDADGVAWGRAWICALVLTVLILGVWELTLRRQGFTPVRKDNEVVWAMQRQALSNRDTTAVALIGASRIQVGLDPELFGRLTQTRPRMLAIDGTAPWPILADLARDSRFTGTVICSLIPFWLGDETPAVKTARKWLRKYHSPSEADVLETRLGMLMDNTFAFRYKNVTPLAIIRHRRKFHALPDPPYAMLRPDRFRPADFGEADVARLLQGRIDLTRKHIQSTPRLNEDALLARIHEINTMVERIVARGGRVIFIRMPSSGMVGQLEETAYPRARFWDLFARHIHGRSLHFADFPSLRGYTCPDGSHLDIRDGPGFTRALVQVLYAQGAMSAPEITP